jgi:hypothetical protein
MTVINPMVVARGGQMTALLISKRFGVISIGN